MASREPETLPPSPAVSMWEPLEQTHSVQLPSVHHPVPVMFMEGMTYVMCDGCDVCDGWMCVMCVTSEDRARQRVV